MVRQTSIWCGLFVSGRLPGTDDFSLNTRRILGERAAYICSNPDCRSNTIGPHSDPERSLDTGVAAHIWGAAPRGPRYDAAQTPEERKSIGNGIWLCATCSRLIDTDRFGHVKESPSGQADEKGLPARDDAEPHGGYSRMGKNCR